MSSPTTRFRSLLLASATGLVGVPLASAAPSTTYEVVSDCDQEGDDCGPQGENDGPGFEQAKGASFIGPNSTPWVAFVVMSSKGIPNRADAPYQCRYYAWELDPTQGPIRRVDGLLVTNNTGNRPCNHPDLKYVGGDDMLFTFGTNDNNQANVQPYAQILSATTGTPRGERTNLGDNNGNDGAATALMLKVGATLDTLELPTAYPKRFVLCYNDNGDNADCTVAQANEDGSVSVVDMIADVIDPANIPRPHMAQITVDGKVAVVAAKGDNRPPEDGAYLRVIDIVNTDAGDGGKLTDQQALMMSDPDNRLYANSPEIGPGPTPGTFFAMNITSLQQADGLKGTSRLYGHVVQFTPDYQLQILSTAPVGHYQAHAAMCVGFYGPEGVQAAMFTESSISNSGPGVVTPVFYDSAAALLIEGSTKVASPWTGDSGYLANLYGNNPNTQGRDFTSCVASIENPGFGLDTGFQKDVRTFVAVPSYGKMTEGDYKNSFFVSFLPGHTPNVVLPPDDPGTPPDTDGDGIPDWEDEEPGTPKSGSAGGCATGSSTGGTSALIFALGAFLVAVRRRRA